jgi:SAM-dependent methyltransferase
LKTELLIGSGSNLSKRLTVDATNTFSNVVTLDYNSDHKPDIVWDLHNLPLPFADNSFDEIHAYEVLEHVGAQGDYKTFFKQFSEFHRLLKPSGYFCATCPSRLSPWAWGDPSHTRILQKENLHFLCQKNYELEVGKTSMSDFRFIYRADFEIYWLTEDENNFRFILKALK